MLKKEDEIIIKDKVTFWEKLTLEEQALILENSLKFKHKKGESIYNSVNGCTGIMIIKGGVLRTYIISNEGKEVTLYRFDKGDICALSASCVLSNITFDVHVDAEEDSEVILVRLNEMEDVYKNIYVENFLLNEAIVRFSDVMWSMEQILFFKFDERLAMFLLDESSRNKDDKIILTHEQIAKHLGSAREVVSRMLKCFSKEGFIQLSRGEVNIIDKSSLRGLIRNIY